MGKLSALTFDARPATASRPAVLATPPRTEPTVPVVQDAFPNRGDAPVATRKSYSLFETDLAHIEKLSDELRKLGCKNVTPSLIVKVCLRYTVKAPPVQLASQIQEIDDEDGRRRRHKKGGVR
jgi:hypothetical protein